MENSTKYLISLITFSHGSAGVKTGSMVGSPWKPEPFLGGSPEKMFFQAFDVEFMPQVAFGGDQYRIVIL